MNNVLQFTAPFRPITGYFEPKTRGQVVPIHTTKQGKAQGVFAAINIAARRMGLKDHVALQYARRAREDYNGGTRSAAAVIADWTATLRAVQAKVHA
jgi:hypothetical protein